MAIYLLDTSALAKYYHAEVGRLVVVTLAEEPLKVGDAKTRLLI